MSAETVPTPLPLRVGERARATGPRTIPAAQRALRPVVVELSPGTAGAVGLLLLVALAALVAMAVVSVVYVTGWWPR